MIAFWLLAAVLVALAAAAVAVPLWRRREPGRTAGADTLAVYRERYAELEAERARGNLDADELGEAVAELEAELAEHTARADAGNPRPAAARRYAGFAVAAAVPVVAVAVYLATGRPGLVGGTDTGGLSPAQVERFRGMPPRQRIQALRPVVERAPEATRAWILLAQAYRATGRYGDAVDAFARARGLGAEDPWLLARQAEALLLANGRRFTDTVERLIQRALALDRSNPLALMLAGHAALGRGDDDRALGYWRRLAEAMPADSDNRAVVERLIARARGEASGRAEAAGSAGAAASAPGADGPRLAVRVSLAPELGAGAPPGAPVFVFARRAGAGGGPPLAVARTTVGALPAELVLSDAQSMTPAAKLSDAERVVVTARVSLDGGVEASSGDLQGRSGPVAVNGDAAVELTIDQRVP